MFAAGDHVVSQAREVNSASGGPSNLFRIALDAGSLTDTDIITDAGALLLAGSDPTAISLTFPFWCVLSWLELGSIDHPGGQNGQNLVTFIPCTVYGMSL